MRPGAFILVAALLGCEPTVQPEPNLRPALLADRSSPPFGTLTLTELDRVSLHLVAEDPNRSDSLVARLFLRSDGQLIYSGFEAQLAQEPDPTLPTGGFHAAELLDDIRLCAVYPAGAELVVVVSDRAFCNPALGATDSECSGFAAHPGGLSDENHWTLVCR